MKVYVQFPEEPLEVAVAMHDDDPFDSIEECKDFVSESEEVGRTFNVVDINGQIHYSGIVTHGGIQEIKPEDFQE